MSGDGLEEEPQASDAIEGSPKSRRTEVSTISVRSMAGAHVLSVDCDDAGMTLKRVLRKSRRFCPATEGKDQTTTKAMTITTTAMTIAIL